MAEIPKLAASSVSLQSTPPATTRIVSGDEMKIKQEDENSAEDVAQKVLLHDPFDAEDHAFHRPGRLRTFLLVGAALVILGWWTSSLVVPMTRHRWLPQTLWAWFFVLIIAFRFIPASLISRPIAAIWNLAVRDPLRRFPDIARLMMLWLGALGITFGSAFIFKRPQGTSVVDRIISAAGVFFLQLVIYFHSVNRKNIEQSRIPISIIFQQSLAIFALKCNVGFKILGFLATAVANFQECGLHAAAAFFDKDVIEKGWLFVIEFCLVISLAAVVQLLYWAGWMQWITKQFAWLGAHLLGASGAETFVAMWTPWFGQVNGTLLVNPYIESMTDSEIFTVMTTSMASMSSLMIHSYVKLGATPRNLIAQSAILIPGAIMNAKIAFPEQDREAVATRSRSSTHLYNKRNNLAKADEALEAMSNGAWLGVKVAGSVLANLLALLTLFIFSAPILVWIFQAFAVKAFDPFQVTAALLTPVTFFLGVPRREVWKLSYIISQRILAGTDVSFGALAKIMGGSHPLSKRGFAVIQFALGSTANLPSVAIQLGAMMALAPNRKQIVAKAVMQAFVIALLSSFQAAAIAAIVL